MSKLHLLLLCIVTFSCQQSASNKNFAFEKSTPESAKYKAELIKQIRLHSPEELVYHFDSYVKNDESEYLVVDVEGESFRAKADLLVNNWEKLSKLRRKFSGFEGAELKGLKFKIDESTNNLIFEDVDQIID